MNCEQAKKLDAFTVAKKLGMRKAKERKNEVWFYYKNEKTASLKIDTRINKWYNHSLGQGGNTLDLIIHILKCSVSEALIFLNNDTNHFSFHQQQPRKITLEKNYQVMEIKNLQHKALIDYLTSRKINISIALKYCQEIHYKINSKKYFAIAFKNDENGYEIRNKYIKGNLINKNITTIKNRAKSVCVFEGFIDFLSYEMIFKDKNFNMDFIILNSISNVKNILQKIKKYDKVFCYLDNDSSGRKATSILLNSHINSLDFSFLYKGFNDINEYLIKARIGT